MCASIDWQSVDPLREKCKEHATAISTLEMITVMCVRQSSVSDCQATRRVASSALGVLHFLTSSFKSATVKGLAR